MIAGNSPIEEPASVVLTAVPTALIPELVLTRGVVRERVNALSVPVVLMEVTFEHFEQMKRNEKKSTVTLVIGSSHSPIHASICNQSQIFSKSHKQIQKNPE
jgi:hypothetical protein